MNKENKIVDFSSITEMLFGDETNIKEFAKAAIISFTDFQHQYNTYLLSGDELNFRKAGHKIKPVAQLLNLDLVLKEYESSKASFRNPKSNLIIENYVANMDKIIKQVLLELQHIVSNN